ncbi:hypothetical protein [Aquabacterium sp. OR-4]|uniref:hypothetical protein n=1 Tax=Aquabacterium sp. OR-4 TaxID=2978127 RepID=UPI0021B4B42D|nr:hypothetical protein [Aquabacterium sp. OR-4]MDT7836624.1 hypothetical protein [Aquabacterium sp. OR-4]
MFRCPRFRQGVAATTAAALLCLLQTGCATHSSAVQPRPGDAAAYAGWPCERLFDELDAVQQRAADVAYAVDSRAGNNMIALGLGVMVFWPALLAMRPDGEEAQQLAELKGRFEALRAAAQTQACGTAPAGMAAHRVQALPVALGERLIYEERAGLHASAHLLGLQVAGLRRDRIEFRVELDGRATGELWQQDLLGNTLGEGAAPLIAWRRLLRRDLALGQVLSGDLAAAGELVATARVRGQVVATGPQTIGGRRFDVAVIELFGEAPPPPPALAETANAARLDGVMAVDRASGMLLRLELRSANPDFALRRRLLRVEPATP